MDASRYISLSEAAALAGISAAHLRRLAERDRLRAWKVGRNWITTEAAVAEYMGDQQKRSKDPRKYRRG